MNKFGIYLLGIFLAHQTAFAGCLDTVDFRTIIFKTSLLKRSYPEYESPGSQKIKTGKIEDSSQFVKGENGIFGQFISHLLKDEQGNELLKIYQSFPENGHEIEVIESCGNRIASVYIEHTHWYSGADWILTLPNNRHFQAHFTKEAGYISRVISDFYIGFWDTIDVINENKDTSAKFQLKARSGGSTGNIPLKMTFQSWDSSLPPEAVVGLMMDIFLYEERAR